jgi:hypothetical protein
MSGPEVELGVISRLLSDAVEELKKLEDEEDLQKEGRGDDAVAIDLRKEMDVHCIDARLNRVWRGYELTP